MSIDSEAAVSLAQSIVSGECSTFGDEVPMATALMALVAERDRQAAMHQEAFNQAVEWQEACREAEADRDRLRADLAEAKEAVPVERLRAVVHFLGPEEITPTAKRILLKLADEYALARLDSQPERCPTCDGSGPDRVDEDFTSGGLDVECGDDWHDSQPSEGAPT